MSKQDMYPAKEGSLEIHGFFSQMVNLTLKDYLRKDLWKLFVNQYRNHTDPVGEWRGEYWGKFMRGACSTYQVTKNQELYETLEETVKEMLSIQDKDGRLSTYVREHEFTGWDVWCRKYTILGMESFYEICKDENLKKELLTSCSRQADYLIDHLKEQGKSILDTAELYGSESAASILCPMLRLYELTGNKKYFDYGEEIIATGCGKDVSLIEEIKNDSLYPYQYAVTKAYETMSCVEGFLEYYKITGKKEYLDLGIRFFDKVIQSDWTIIGCSGCNGEFFDHSSLTQTNLITIPPLQETCVTVTLMGLCQYLLCLTGEGKYVSYMETSAYNALLGAINTEDQKMKRAVGYTYVPEGQKAPSHEGYLFDSYSPLYHGTRGRSIGGFKVMEGGKTFGCCAADGGRGTGSFPLYLMTTSEDKESYFLNVYDNFEYKYGDFSLSILANPYGKEGAEIHVDSKGKKVTLGLYVPSWAKDFKVKLNGKEIHGEEKKGYLLFQKEFNHDTISVSWNSPLIATVLNGKVCFRKGVIVLAKDERLGDYDISLSKTYQDGEEVPYKTFENKVFPSETSLVIEDKIHLVDYASAGKNFDSEESHISAWMDGKGK